MQQEGRPAGWPSLCKEWIIINEKLTKELFQNNLRSLLPDAGTGAEEIWADFARECVEMKQYVDFIEEPDEVALCRWHDTLLAGFVLLRQNFGEGIATAVCNLSLDHLCLYPFEMENAAQELKAGGNVDSLLRLIEEGLLDAPTPVFPKLQDVAPHLVPEQGPKMISQF